MTNRPIVGEAPVEDGLAPLDSLEIMAGRLSMSSTEWLEEALAFLEEKSQLLLQGPRGAGKTFIARELARYLAGYPSRVVTVQFHPGTSYEDFVQGLRAEPTTPPASRWSMGGSCASREWPLRIPIRASSCSSTKSTRGNVPAVFGEPVPLLEYRDERLATSPKRRMPTRVNQ